MRTRGFTLVEVMIAIAILAIVAAIAIPAYNGYIRESRLGALRMNLDSLRIAVEAHRLDSPIGTYGPTTAFVGATTGNTFGWSPANNTLDWQGWQPTGDGGGYTYFVTPTQNGLSYDMAARDNASGLNLVCTNRLANCTP